MKKLILVDGAAGTGKSDFAKFLATRQSGAIKLIKKSTTRAQRDNEKSDLFGDLDFPSINHTDFMGLTTNPGFFWYEYGTRQEQNLYGVSRDDILEALNTAQIGVLIIRDFYTIEKIKASLPNVECISLFIYSDLEKVVERLVAEGYDDEQIKHRTARLPLAWGDYLQNTFSYDYSIINSSSANEYRAICSNFFKHIAKEEPNQLHVEPYRKYLLPAPLEGFKQEMVRKLQSKPFEKNIFLMMKFRKNNKLIGEFISDELARFGFNCVIADEEFWDITRNTYNPIAVLHCCKFGIALFDEPEEKNDYSPNVAYELGMMQAQLKECLILRHHSLGPAPFDIVKDLYVNYSDNLQIKAIVASWVSKILRLQNIER